MKKTSLFLVLCTCFSVLTVGCGTNGGNDSDGSTTTTTATTTLTTSVTTTAANTQDPENGENNNGNTEGARFTLDGDLADWKDIRSISLVGNTESTKEKSVTFYGATAEEGLYLACEVKHDLYMTGNSNWWENSNFEFFINSGRDNQYYVYANGTDKEAMTSANVDSAKMKTSALEDQGTAYHTVVEVFVSNDNIPDGAVTDGTLSVGVAWKTVGDKIAGGEAAGGGEDEYWVPAGSWPDNENQPVVKNDGIYLKADVDNRTDSGTDNGADGGNNDTAGQDSRSRRLKRGVTPGLPDYFYK